MSEYHVVLAEDARMPQGKDWLLIGHDDGAMFVVRRAAISQPEIMVEGWAAYRQLVAAGPPGSPQRLPERRGTHSLRAV